MRDEDKRIYLIRDQVEDGKVTREELAEMFNHFIEHWTPPIMHGHLLDDDDNDAEWIRRAIRSLE